ncbi:MAG: hypothetical protein BRC23_02575 [Parcubacteria group bacterium SW_4_49_11]|nr:MAG: hypothetical protein BRC23_02575 [Parcubacteria group bacterium SW_4_49_11]
MLFVLTFLAALVISLAAFFMVLRLPGCRNLVPDRQRSRDIHDQPRPRIGGLILIPLFLAGFGILTHFSFQGLDMLTWEGHYGGIIFGALALLGYGIIDERRDLAWYTQLLLQVIIVLAVVEMDIRIHEIRVPFMGLVNLDWVTGTLAGIEWIFPADLLAFIWIFAVMNVVNWLDGVDGLAGGVGVVGFSILAALSLSATVGQPHIALIALLLAGLYAGFLWFNFHPSRIFLGTPGSMFLGFILAVLAMVSGGKIATAGLVLAFPIIDAGFVIVTRLRAGVSIFQADNRHLHHRLLAWGLGQRQAVLFLYAVSLLFGGSALVLQTQGKFVAFLVGLAAMGALYVWLTSMRSRKPEARKK